MTTHRMSYRALACLALLGSAACAQVPAMDTTPVRVIILFQQATRGEAPNVLAQLAEASGVGVRYAAAVSEREHAYLLTCPPADPQCQGAIAALAASPGIARVQADAMKRIH